MKENKKELEFVELISKTIEENYRSKKAEETQKEIVEFLNDVIDALGEISKKQGRYSESAFGASLFHMVMPLSYSTYVNFLAGYLPTCFMQLRLIVETCAKTICADAVFKDDKFFASKLMHLESFLERGDDGRPMSTSKFFSEYLSNIVGKDLASEIKTLWHKLSQNWLHLKGYIAKVVERTVEAGPPSWAIGAPMVYDTTDRKDLKELEEKTRKTRCVFAKIKNLWVNLDL